MINWAFFPKSTPAPEVARDVVRVFEEAEPELRHRAKELTSDVVLSIVRLGLQQVGFEVEAARRPVRRSTCRFALVATERWRRRSMPTPGAASGRW